jgi:hypothetical protein
MTQPQPCPVILRAEEVRAALDGRLTMLWRPLKRQPPSTTNNGTPYTGFQRTTLPCAEGFDLTANMDNPKYIDPCPFGDVGTLLWGRETWGWYGRNRGKGPEGGLHYRADLASRTFTELPDPDARWQDFLQAWKTNRVNKWRPSSNMPYWASRPKLRNLEVTDIAVRPVQSIGPAEAVEAGCLRQPDECPMCRGGVCSRHQPPLGSFRALWNRHNKRPEHQWEANPVAWAATIKEVKS